MASRRSLLSKKCQAVLLIILIISPGALPAPMDNQVLVEPGPASGIVIVEAPGLLLTDRKLVSQLIFVDLDPLFTLAKHVSIPQEPRNLEFEAWYRAHIERTRESVRQMLTQLDKTFVAKSKTPTKRTKRFAGMLIGIIVMTVIAAVVGTTMTIANSVSVETVHQKQEQLEGSLLAIRAQIARQRIMDEDLINAVNETVIVQNSHTELLGHSSKMHLKNAEAWKNFYNLVDPINFITQDYLREIQFNIASLIKGNIPLYFVSTDKVRQILTEMHHVVVDDRQLNIALEMGNALPMYIDLQRLQLSFLLNLPLVAPEKMYQTKNVINVGTWKNDMHVMIQSPKLVAYQPWNDGTYLVPNLSTCIVFKDINYLCPGKPFIPEDPTTLCGVRDVVSDVNVCQVTMSHPDVSAEDTRAVLVNRQWLVSTKRSNMTVTYAVHGTFKVVPLKYRVSLITVPKDVIVTVGSHALFYVSGEAVEDELELINIFGKQDIPVDEDLEFLLKHNPNHTMKLSIRPGNITIDEHLFNYQEMELLRGRDWIQVKLYAAFFSILALMSWMTALTVLVFKQGLLQRRAQVNGAPHSGGDQAQDYVPMGVLKVPRAPII